MERHGQKHIFHVILRQKFVQKVQKPIPLLSLYYCIRQLKKYIKTEIHKQKNNQERKHERMQLGFNETGLWIFCPSFLKNMTSQKFHDKGLSFPELSKSWRIFNKYEPFHMSYLVLYIRDSLRKLFNNTKVQMCFSNDHFENNGITLRKHIWFFHHIGLLSINNLF